MADQPEGEARERGAAVPPPDPTHQLLEDRASCVRDASGYFLRKQGPTGPDCLTDRHEQVYRYVGTCPGIWVRVPDTRSDAGRRARGPRDPPMTTESRKRPAGWSGRAARDPLSEA